MTNAESISRHREAIPSGTDRPRPVVAVGSAQMTASVKGAERRIKRRVIEHADLPAIADLLTTGFPERPRSTWLLGLDRMSQRRVPADRPRFGLMLEAEDRPVGVLLMIFSEQQVDGQMTTRCNLSSWYTQAPFAPHASLLLNAALKSRDVTFVNVSPAPRTEPIIEAQGFRSFCHGSLLTLPALSRPRDRTAVMPLHDADAERFAERDLLRDHLALGCLCFSVATESGPEPFVFARAPKVRGMLPCVQLLFCRSVMVLTRYAAALGRALLRRGFLGMLVDAEGPLAGIATRRINASQPRYARGPHPPRPGDLAYTELAIFND